jgi:hypothetical protein
MTQFNAGSVVFSAAKDVVKNSLKNQVQRSVAIVKQCSSQKK